MDNWFDMVVGLAVMFVVVNVVFLAILGKRVKELKVMDVLYLGGFPFALNNLGSLLAKYVG